MLEVQLNKESKIVAIKHYTWIVLTKIRDKYTPDYLRDYMDKIRNWLL